MHKRRFIKLAKASNKRLQRGKIINTGNALQEIAKKREEAKANRHRLWEFHIKRKRN